MTRDCAPFAGVDYFAPDRHHSGDCPGTRVSGGDGSQLVAAFNLQWQSEVALPQGLPVPE
jgi:hypothetical protein